MPKSNNVEVKVYIRSQRYRIYYSYNYNSTFLDLLEYISFLFPEFGICQCFEFQVDNNTSYYNYHRSIKLEKNDPIRRYSEYLSNLELFKNEKKYCTCNKQYLKYSKTELIASFEEEIDKLKRNNSIQTEKINNLDREKRRKGNK